MKVLAENEQKYRLLTEEDIINDDDEFLEDDCKTWSIVPRHFVGARFSYNFFVPHRRIVV